MGLVAAGPSEGLVYNDKELDYNDTESGAWMLATHRRNRGRGHGDASFASARGSHVRQMGRDEAVTTIRSSRDEILSDDLDERHMEGSE